LVAVHKSSLVETLRLPSKTDTNAQAAFDSSTGNAVLAQAAAETASVLSPRTGH
jgi:hypothetical protein